jgi:hypothetical protein
MARRFDFIAMRKYRFYVRPVLLKIPDLFLVLEWASDLITFCSMKELLVTLDESH